MIEIDTKGIDESLSAFGEEITDKMESVGKAACAHAKVYGAYKNHTYNLRNGPGFAVIWNGKIIKMEVPTDGSHPDASHYTQSLLMYGTYNALVLADGMIYASFVEAKGFDVIKTSAIYAEAKLNE